jgi:non-lysosomal glucosylceramidase
MSVSKLDTLVPTKYGWHVGFDKQFDPKWKPFGRPRLKQILEYVPLFLRYLRMWYRLKKARRRAHMDFLNPVPLQQIYGAPIGGLGCGTIGRGFRGEFCRYQLVPGLYEFQTVEANTFTVCIRRRNTTSYCQVLTPNRLRSKGFRSWNCAFPKENGHYQALYPQSWTTYDLSGQNIRLLCKQLSPFIPHNYKDSSLPVASFLWYIENLNDEPVEVSLMFTWQAGSASQEFLCQDISHESINVSDEGITANGVSIKQILRDMKLEYCIMGKKEVYIE